MRGLGMLSLLLGLAAVGASVFAKVETWGNFKAAAERVAGQVRAGELGGLELRIVADYSETLTRLHLAAWICGGLAVLLGVVGMARGRGTNLVPGLGAVLGAAGAVLTFLTMP